MSKKIRGFPEITNDVSAWFSLLEETDQEILASGELTNDEKHRLLDIDVIAEGDPQPGACLGTPVSQTIIEDRGER